MITIQCSNCGYKEIVRNTMKAAGWFVDNGWRSFGGAFYCPVCSGTWDARNDEPLSDANETFRRVMNLLIDDNA